MADSKTTQRSNDPDHQHYRRVIVGAGIGIALLILGLRHEKLTQRLDALSSVATGVATIAGLLVVALRADEQRKEQQLAAHRDAWRTIVMAAGRTGSFGRTEAIEYLASERVVLDGVDLSGAYLRSIRLPPGTLIQRAHVRQVGNHPCVLSHATLAGVHLTGTAFVCVELENANLSKALLGDCFFAAAKAPNCDFSIAFMFGVTIQDSSFSHANLSYANLVKGKLERTSFEGASFSGANMSQVQATATKFTAADFRGAKVRNAFFDSCDFTGSLWDDSSKLEGNHFSNCSFGSVELRRFFIDAGAMVK